MVFIKVACCAVLILGFSTTLTNCAKRSTQKNTQEIIASQNSTKLSSKLQPANSADLKTSLENPSGIPDKRSRNSLRDIAYLLQPLVNAFGNSLFAIKEAVPDALSGSILGILTFKGILLTVYNLIKTIILPFMFWTIMFFIVLIGAIVFVLSNDVTVKPEVDQTDLATELINDFSRNAYDFEQPVYNALENTYTKYQNGQGQYGNYNNYVYTQQPYNNAYHGNYTYQYQPSSKYQTPSTTTARYYNPYWIPK